MALLIHYQAGNGTSGRPSTIANNNRFAYLDSLPFDGLVLNLPLTFSFQTPGTATSYATAMGQLSPVQGKMTKCTRHYARVSAQFFADPFDDWTTAQANWVNLAKAVNDCGYDGIYYDNEEYNGQLFWAYPGSAYKYTSSQSRSQYAEKWRARGNELMAAMRSVHPTVKVIHAHTPAWSQSGAPRLVYGDGGGPVHEDGSDLRGYFAAGMFAAAPGSVVDGGEDYAFRTASDFQASWNWLHNTWPAITPGTVIPSSLASSWKASYSVGFGVYDQPWPTTLTMTAATLQACVTNSLNRADDLVWTYAENNDYLTPNAAPASFQTAVAAGKAAATPAAPAAPKNLRITAHT